MAAHPKNIYGDIDGKAMVSSIPCWEHRCLTFLVILMDIGSPELWQALERTFHFTQGCRNSQCLWFPQWPTDSLRRLKTTTKNQLQKTKHEQQQQEKFLVISHSYIFEMQARSRGSERNFLLKFHLYDSMCLEISKCNFLV